jgi:cytochrome c-type biogenesis protein CcmH/NrfG
MKTSRRPLASLAGEGSPGEGVFAAGADQENTVFEELPLGARDLAASTAPQAASAPAVENTAVRIRNRIRAVVAGARARARRARGPIVSFLSRRPRLLVAVLAVGGSALVGALFLAGRASSSASAARDAAAAAATRPRAPGEHAQATPRELAAVESMAARGERKQAIARLRELRKEHPADGDYPATLSRLYFEQRRYPEGLAAFRTAIRNDPRRRSDPVLIGHVITSLQEDSFRSTAEDFLRQLGSAAKPRVKEAARGHANPRVRARARELVRDWNHRPFLRWRS